MRSIRVGAVGCGYWGPNLVRNFARNPYSEVEAVCDMRYERAVRVGAEYRIPMVTDDPADLTKWQMPNATLPVISLRRKGQPSAQTLIFAALMMTSLYLQARSCERTHTAMVNLCRPADAVYQ